MCIQAFGILYGTILLILSFKTKPKTGLNNFCLLSAKQALGEKPV